MKKKVPGIVMAVAILHFVGGGLGTIGSLCGLGSLAMNAGGGFGGFGAPNAQAKQQQEKIQQETDAAIEARLPGHKGINVVQLTIGLVLGVLMIVAGVGLLQLQPWGRSLSIVYAWISILNRIFATITGLLAAMATSEVMERVLKQDPSMANNPAMNSIGPIAQTLAIGGVIFSALFIFYPIFVLIVMYRPHVRAAFRDQTAPLDEIEEQESWKGQRKDDWDEEGGEPDERIRPGGPR